MPWNVNVCELTFQLYSKDEVVCCFFVLVWSRLRDQKELERFKPEIEEEYEDTQGNVVNKKTYEDLRRQGLL